MARRWAQILKCRSFSIHRIPVSCSFKRVFAPWCLSAVSQISFLSLLRLLGFREMPEQAKVKSSTRPMPIPIALDNNHAKDVLIVAHGLHTSPLCFQVYLTNSTLLSVSKDRHAFPGFVEPFSKIPYIKSKWGGRSKVGAFSYGTCTLQLSDSIRLSHASCP